MTKYDIALSVLPSIVSNSEYTNSYTIAHKAFEIAAAFEEVASQYKVDIIPPIDFGMTDEFPMWDDLGMPISVGNIDIILANLDVYGCTDQNIYGSTDVISEYVVNGNVDVQGLNISLNPVK